MDDSARLVREIALLTLQKTKNNLQKEIDNQPKIDKKAEEAAQKAEALADFNAKIDKVAAQKKLLGDAKPTSLTGSVTIDTGTICLPTSGGGLVVARWDFHMVVPCVTEPPEMATVHV